MKNILGLDLGPNSIGWAVIHTDDEANACAIAQTGVRIIPLDEESMTNFNKGTSQSQAHERTCYRSARRRGERAKLRRQRLHRVLALLGYLPPHYAKALDRYGNFLPGQECKLAWAPSADGGHRFLFEEAFREMVADFSSAHPTADGETPRLSHDWTLYYLRQKALTQPVRPEELAWILLSFNQKRGYHQLREEEEEADDKPGRTRSYFDEQVVTSVVNTGRTLKGQKVLIVTLSDGTRGKVCQRTIPAWVGQSKSLIATIDLDSEGHDRYDEELRGPSLRLRVPTEQEWDEEWALVKQRTEHNIRQASTTVGAYIYQLLRREPGRKVRGKLVRTIERSFYREELTAILRAQSQFHPALHSPQMLQACATALYPNNAAARAALMSGDVAQLLLRDILFYQRPLRSKRSLVSDCPYESRTFSDRRTGQERSEPLKCISRSHPRFQEFRIWQFVGNLRIIRREDGANVTAQLLPDAEARAELAKWLSERKNVKEKELLKLLTNKHSETTGDDFVKPKDQREPSSLWPPARNRTFKKEKDYRWNYADDKAFPAGETRADILGVLGRVGIDAKELTADREQRLWHLLYSISDREALRSGLAKLAVATGWPAEPFATEMSKLPAFAHDYGSYSYRAIGRLLPLMREGKAAWSAEEVEKAVGPARLAHLMAHGKDDEQLPSKVRERLSTMQRIEDFQGLPVWLACYVVYGRHSESGDVERWHSPDDVDRFLRGFRRHSLRNPVVECVVLETLRVVRDVWRSVGKIDEIHVEMGREMKLPADARRKLTATMAENERTNLRIRALLAEMALPDMDVEGVRRNSPSQQSLLRIFEEYAWANLGKPADEKEKKEREEIEQILRKFNETDAKLRPTRQEIYRYRLWLEQRYQSPYTGRIIPLSRLFTKDYEIEHIIPRSRFFDDSMSNKVICEAEVNKEKAAMLGHEFIQHRQGSLVTLGGGGEARIFSVEEYEAFVREHYAAKDQTAKRNKLLMDDIPDSFIQRQLNDTRYITRLMLNLLSRIVREEGEVEATSKHVLATNGSITSVLKRDWGVNDVWSQLMLPRFERLNQLTNSSNYTAVNANGHKVPVVPLSQLKGFNLKRIDHRHHAMDAIVTACATRSIVNYLHNASANADGQGLRTDLRKQLCEKRRTDTDGHAAWTIRQPWPTFASDLRLALDDIVPSFKQNLRILTRTKNLYQRRDERGRKVLVAQQSPEHWAVRKALHKETYYADVNLRRVRTVKLEVALKQPSRVVERDLKRKLKELLREGLTLKQITAYFEENKETWSDVDLKHIAVYYFAHEVGDRYYASRVELDKSFTADAIRKKVTDTGIQKILLRHLQQSGGDPSVAFSPDGIERMNANLAALNDGKPHQPIYKVRKYEKGSKFAVGQSGCKSRQFVEGAKGTNLFFAIYEHEQLDEDGRLVRRRDFATIPLAQAIERQKQGLPPAPCNDDGCAPTYVLSPGDLVYLPTDDEARSGVLSQPLAHARIYKVVSCGGKRIFCVPVYAAKPIVEKLEFSSQNKQERALTGEMIKETCLPLRVDRLGRILGVKSPTKSQTDD